jgi:SNF2 family DNA or RNA helicase
LKERVAPLAFEASKADCLDLPPRRYNVVRLTMTGTQRAVYEALEKDYIATLDGVVPDSTTTEVLSSVDLAPLTFNEKAMQMYAEIEAEEENPLATDDRRISVTFAATLLIRLQQIAAGHIKSDDGVTHFIKGCKEEWLEENLPVLTAPGWNHKCVIFCRYTADIEILTKLATDLKIGYVTLSGKNSKHAADVVEKFQTDPDTRLFIGNVAVASTGITLTAADRVVFYTNSFSWGDRSQAEDRTYRIGQERVVEYTDLVAEGSVDEPTLDNLEAKSSLAVHTVQGLKAVLLRGQATRLAGEDTAS